MLMVSCYVAFKRDRRIIGSDVHVDGEFKDQIDHI